MTRKDKHEFVGVLLFNMLGGVGGVMYGWAGVIAGMVGILVGVVLGELLTPDTDPPSAEDG